MALNNKTLLELALVEMHRRRDVLNEQIAECEAAIAHDMLPAAPVAPVNVARMHVPIELRKQAQDSLPDRVAARADTMRRKGMTSSVDVLAYARTRVSFFQKDLKEQFKMTSSAAGSVIRRLKRFGKIKRVGDGEYVALK